jgi:hypothetical protein
MHIKLRNSTTCHWKEIMWNDDKWKWVYSKNTNVAKKFKNLKYLKPGEVLAILDFSEHTSKSPNPTTNVATKNRNNLLHKPWK